MKTMESVVCSGADNALLGRLEKRARILGKYVAAHPMTVERVLAELDATGPSEAGDVIQSLLWEKVQADHLSACLSDQMRETPNTQVQAGPAGVMAGIAPGTES